MFAQQFGTNSRNTLWQKVQIIRDSQLCAVFLQHLVDVLNCYSEHYVHRSLGVARPPLFSRWRTRARVDCVLWHA